MSAVNDNLVAPAAPAAWSGVEPSSDANAPTRSGLALAAADRADAASCPAAAVAIPMLKKPAIPPNLH